MGERRYDITVDPEANVLFERCSQVDAALWEALAAAEPDEVRRRTGVTWQGGAYYLPFLNQRMVIIPGERRSYLEGREDEELGFQLCLAALLYLLKVEKNGLGARQISPKECRGGVTFFQGPHSLPVRRLEERYGRDGAAFRRAGEMLGGQPREAGDLALGLEAFPGLWVEVILWLADEEFEATVSLTIPAGLEQYWALDGIWAVLNVVTRELWRAGE